MIEKTAAFFDGFANSLGLSIKIPRPGKAVRSVSTLTNSVVGGGLVIVGIVASSKALVGVGMLGLAGAVSLAADKKSGSMNE